MTEDEQNELINLRVELRRWKGFATNLWRDAQTAAADLGDEEEMFEAHGYEAKALGLSCSFEPEDEDEDD